MDSINREPEAGHDAQLLVHAVVGSFEGENNELRDRAGESAVSKVGVGAESDNAGVPLVHEQSTLKA